MSGANSANMLNRIVHIGTTRPPFAYRQTKFNRPFRQTQKQYYNFKHSEFNLE